MGYASPKIHVLADETLGGVKREYVEVERKAEDGKMALYNGKIFEITYVGHGCATLDGRIHLPIKDIRVLEPTNIVHIEDDSCPYKIRGRFRLVDRKAKVGERVIVVNEAFPEEYYEPGYTNGDIFTAKCVDIDDVLALKGTDIRLYHSEYRVLVPVESESSPQSTEDVIANLVARVAQLERENKAMLDVYERGQKWTHARINGVKDDIETWAQEHEKTKRELDDKIEMCIDDIVTLDERTEGDIVLCRSNIEVKERRCYGCRTC